MASKKQIVKDGSERNPPIFRPTDADRALLESLGKKCGLNMTSVIRIALREYAEQKGVAA